MGTGEASLDVGLSRINLGAALVGCNLTWRNPFRQREQSLSQTVGVIV